MKQSTVEQLIEKSILILEEDNLTHDQQLKRYDFVSYVVAEGYVLQTPSQTNTNTISTVTYVQFIDDSNCWVLQLEGFREDPNNIDPNSQYDFNVFKQIDF